MCNEDWYNRTRPWCHDWHHKQTCHNLNHNKQQNAQDNKLHITALNYQNQQNLNQNFVHKLVLPQQNAHGNELKETKNNQTNQNIKPKNNLHHDQFDNNKSKAPSNELQNTLQNNLNNNQNYEINNYNNNNNPHSTINLSLSETPIQKILNTVGAKFTSNEKQHPIAKIIHVQHKQEQKENKKQEEKDDEKYTIETETPLTPSRRKQNKQQQSYSLSNSFSYDPTVTTQTKVTQSSALPHSKHTFKQNEENLQQLKRLTQYSYHKDIIAYLANKNQFKHHYIMNFTDPTDAYSWNYSFPIDMPLNYVQESMFDIVITDRVFVTQYQSCRTLFPINVDPFIHNIDDHTPNRDRFNIHFHDILQHLSFPQIETQNNTPFRDTYVMLMAILLA